MARTQKPKQKVIPFEVQYSKLPLVEQRLTWLYLQGIITNCSETGGFGLDPYQSPAVLSNWKASGNVQSYIPQSTWRYRAQKAAKIAIGLYNDGIGIDEPYLPKKDSAETEDEP